MNLNIKVLERSFFLRNWRTILCITTIFLTQMNPQYIKIGIQEIRDRIANSDIIWNTNSSDIQSNEVAEIISDVTGFNQFENTEVFNAIVDKLCKEYEIGMYQNLSESLETVYKVSNGLLGTSEG